MPEREPKFFKGETEKEQEKNLEKKEGKPLRIIFDLDETLAACDRGHYEYIKSGDDEPEIRPGAEQLIKKLKEEGHTLILWTTATKEWVDRVFAQSEIFRNAFSEIYTRENDPGNPQNYEEECIIELKIKGIYKKIQEVEDEQRKWRLKQVLNDIVSGGGKLPSLIDADVLIDDFVQKERELEEDGTLKKVLKYNTIQVPPWFSISKTYEASLQQRLRDRKLSRRERKRLKLELKDLEERKQRLADRSRNWDKDVLKTIDKLTDFSRVKNN